MPHDAALQHYATSCSIDVLVLNEARYSTMQQHAAPSSCNTLQHDGAWYAARCSIMQHFEFLGNFLSTFAYYYSHQ
jgi:hypothetical protein